MSTPQFPPHGVYGGAQDGLGDPQRASVLDRYTKSAARLAEQRADGELMSPFIGTLRSAADKALTPPPARPAPAQKPVFVASRQQAAKG
jgi:hypothetical protein